MKVNNSLITVAELNTLGYTSVSGVTPPADSSMMVSKQFATSYYQIPSSEPWNSYVPSRLPKYQDFPISCYCDVVVANVLEGNPNPVYITYLDCSNNMYYSSVPFGQALIINQCHYVSGDSGPLTGCGILPGSVYAPGCEVTYSNRRNVVEECGTTTTTTSTTTTIPPSLNLVSVFSSATGQTQMVGGFSSQSTVSCAISTDYGATFRITEDIFGPSQLSSDDVVSNANGTLCALSTAYQVWLSDDAGINWSASNTGSGNSYLAISSNTIYLSKFPGYLLSTSDGGLSWTELTAMGFRYWGHLQALNNYLIAAVNDGTVSTKVYISHSSGTTLTYTFSYTGTPVPIYVGIAGSGQYMYVVTDGYSGKYYKSVNYGQTFSTIITNSSSQIFTSACNSKNAAYLLLFRLSNVTGQTTLMRSTNYGVSFSNITSTPFVNNSVVRSSMSDDGAYVSILVQVGGGTSPYQLWLSSDAGLTWTQKF